jgi:hypothetical protein
MFGFTEEEVKELVKKVVSLPNQSAVDEEEVVKQINDHYNGYEEGSKKIYTPWSVVNHLQ